MHHNATAANMHRQDMKREGHVYRPTCLYKYLTQGRHLEGLESVWRLPAGVMEYNPHIIIFADHLSLPPCNQSRMMATPWRTRALVKICSKNASDSITVRLPLTWIYEVVDPAQESELIRLLCCCRLAWMSWLLPARLYCE